MLGMLSSPIINSTMTDICLWSEPRGKEAVRWAGRNHPVHMRVRANRTPRRSRLIALFGFCSKFDLDVGMNHSS